MNLEINNLNEIIVKVNEGSGIVLKFEADKKCYILTAYHNIETSIENEENLELFSDNNERYNIIGEYFYDKKNDFALLEVDYINKNIPIVQYNNHILPDDKIIFMGYPDKGEGTRKDLSGKVNEWNRTKTAIKVVEENMQGAFVVKEKTNEVIVGFSGSGIFKKDGQKLSLIGILKSLPEEDFDYKEISCVPIEKILEFIQYKNLAKQTFENPIMAEWNKINHEDKRNLKDKLEDACPKIKGYRINQYIRQATLGKAEQLIYSEREISTIKYMIFDECQDELMSFIENNEEDNNLTFNKINNLLENYIKRAKKIIDDKRDEYKYGNFSDDIIKKIILDLIDTCYISFDEEGIYE